jgi:hypothetical protein
MKEPPWSQDDSERAVRLLVKGITLADLAKALKRSPRSVSLRLSYLRRVRGLTELPFCSDARSGGARTINTDRLRALIDKKAR